VTWKASVAVLPGCLKIAAEGGLHASAADVVGNAGPLHWRNFVGSLYDLFREVPWAALWIGILLLLVALFYIVTVGLETWLMG